MTWQDIIFLSLLSLQCIRTVRTYLHIDNGKFLNEKHVCDLRMYKYAQYVNYRMMCRCVNNYERQRTLDVTVPRDYSRNFRENRQRREASAFSKGNLHSLYSTPAVCLIISSLARECMYVCTCIVLSHTRTRYNYSRVHRGAVCNIFTRFIVCSYGGHPARRTIRRNVHSPAVDAVGMFTRCWS